MSRVKGSEKTGGIKKGSKHKKTLKQEEAIKYIQDEIRKELEPILIALIEKCQSGDMSAIREALDRLVGKPTEKRETKLTGDLSVLLQEIEGKKK